MLFLSSERGLLWCVAAFVAGLVLTFVCFGLASASTRGHWTRGVFVLALLTAKLTDLVVGGALLLSLALNVVRFAKGS